MKIDAHKYNRKVKNVIKGFVLDELPANKSLQLFIDDLKVKFVSITQCNITHPLSDYAIEYWNGAGNLVMNFNGGYVFATVLSHNIMDKHMLHLASIILGRDEINKALMDSFREIEKMSGLQ